MELTSTISWVEVIWASFGLVGSSYAINWWLLRRADQAFAKDNGQQARGLAGDILVGMGIGCSIAELCNLAAGILSMTVPPATGTVTIQGIATAALLIIMHIAIVWMLWYVNMKWGRLAILGSYRLHHPEQMPLSLESKDHF